MSTELFLYLDECLSHYSLKPWRHVYTCKCDLFHVSLSPFHQFPLVLLLLLNTHSSPGWEKNEWISLIFSADNWVLTDALADLWYQFVYFRNNMTTAWTRLDSLDDIICSYPFDGLSTSLWATRSPFKLLTLCTITFYIMRLQYTDDDII